MNEQEFKDRTKKFALRVIKLVEALPRKQTAQVIGKQLLRAGTSVGANYRAACRAKSTLESSTSSALSRRRRTNRYSGWNCWSKLN